VDGDAVVVYVGKELVHVAIEVLDDLGAHGMGTLAHGRAVLEGCERCQAALDAPCGVAVQGSVQALVRQGCFNVIMEWIRHIVVLGKKIHHQVHEGNKGRSRT
jgi:hypothetical protein